MPLNMNDPYLRAERQPPALVALGVRLKRAYGVGADAFGVKGNDRHYTGFHRSRDFLLYSRQGNEGDPSVAGSKNQGGNGNNNSAFDFTPGVWGTDDNRQKMIVITKRLRAAARRNDPRLAAYYEFAGTEDGVNVVTFYAQGGATKKPFDRTHLEHIHGSKYRSMSDHDDTGLGDVILGVEGGEDDMGYGPVVMRGDEDRLTITIPPVGGTPVVPGPSEVFMNLGRDQFGHKSAWRVFLGDGGGSASPAPGSANGIIVLDSMKVASVNLPKGTRLISIVRWGLNAGGTPVDPYAKNPDGSPVYPDPSAAGVDDESLSFAFEVKW